MTWFPTANVTNTADQVSAGNENAGLEKLKVLASAGDENAGLEKLSHSCVTQPVNRLCWNIRCHGSEVAIKG
jgi:hypothetical protein